MMRFIKPGLQTSLQDLGRNKMMHQGVSHGGAMDPVSLRIANWLVGNAPDKACLEITLVGPTIEFEEAMTIGIYGANFNVSLNDRSIETHSSIQINKGDILKFGTRRNGARAYLAFSANLQLEKVLGSYSTHITAQFGGFKGRAFAANDRLEMINTGTIKSRSLPPELLTHYSGKYLIRCCDSVESKDFSACDSTFYNSTYQVSADSNRMGLRLIGNPLILEGRDNISSGLTQGTIQVPQSGLPIISSVDGQTIGGYPRIANVITADLPLLGQLNANDRIQFQKVTTQEAITFLTEKMKTLKQFI